MQMVLGTVCFEIQLRLYSHSLSKQLDDRHCSVYFDNEIFATVHPREKREAGSNCNNAWHLSDLDPTKEWFRTRPPPPTYGETWSTEAPVNLSCVEHEILTSLLRGNAKVSTDAPLPHSLSTVALYCVYGCMLNITSTNIPTIFNLNFHPISYFDISPQYITSICKYTLAISSSWRRNPRSTIKHAALAASSCAQLHAISRSRNLWTKF